MLARLTGKGSQQASKQRSILILTTELACLVELGWLGGEGLEPGVPRAAAFPAQGLVELDEQQYLRAIPHVYSMVPVTIGTW